MWDTDTAQGGVNEEWTACGDEARGGAHAEGAVVESVALELGSALRSSFSFAAKAFSSLKYSSKLPRLTSGH